MQEADFKGAGGRGYGYSPRVTRLAGLEGLPELPDLYTQTQIGQYPVGGYQGFGHLAGFEGQKSQYNVKYPIEKLNITYAQMKAQLMDFAQRVYAVAGVIMSPGTKPGDENLTARVRDSHFEGQRIGTPATIKDNPNIDFTIIRNVDGRVFTGEVSGRGGTVGFEIGEKLGVITPSTGGGNRYDIDIDALKKQMDIALVNFQKFERTLQARAFGAGKVDQIIDKMGQSQGGMAGVRTSAGSMLSQAAMRKN